MRCNSRLLDTTGFGVVGSWQIESEAALPANPTETTMAKTPTQTPRDEIRRLAELEAETIVWLASCPLRADGIYETAGYVLEEIADQIVEQAEAEGLTEIVESIAAAREQGDYSYGTGEDDEVAFWRHIATMA